MKIDELIVTTKIKKLTGSNVSVIVSCNDEEIDSFVVNSNNMFDVMMKAKSCISACITKLSKYKS